MCGFVYVNSKKIDKSSVDKALNAIKYRGPDFKDTKAYDANFFLSHCRLSILDVNERSNQPMRSKNNAYSIIFNGEIYNYKAIAKKLNLRLKTTSDTEVILEGYAKIGNEIFELLDGMFSLVIHNHKDKSWVATRDSFGIKPLYIYNREANVVIASENKAICSLVNVTVSKDSVREWETFRSPLPGKTFFNEIEEVLPGQIIEKNKISTKHFVFEDNENKFDQDYFEFLLQESIAQHTLSDVQNTSLVSGGIDSSIICKETNFQNYYSVGIQENNEFIYTKETAKKLNKNILNHMTTPETIISNWKFLTETKGEPILVPNEGLIYEICKKMKKEEKVVLTGEGADEMLFGYDRIFRWSLNNEFDFNSFLSMYSYSKKEPTSRMKNYILDMKIGKTTIEFLEDYFYIFHLPVLLRRMDFASMCASKEARVPFVSKSLINYTYRANPAIKIDNTYSKKPLRQFSRNNNLDFIIDRKKIGFSANLDSRKNRSEEYKNFRDIVISTLGWDEVNDQ